MAKIPTREVSSEALEGLFALLTEETTHLSSPGAGVRFTPVIDTAKSAVKDLRDRGAQFIIALTHLDIAEDRGAGF